MDVHSQHEMTTGHSGSMGAMGGHAADLMAAVDVACPARLAECADLSDLNHHARDAKVKIPSPAVSWIAPWPDESRLDSLSAATVQPTMRDRSCISGASPPLNVLFCVYLD